MALSCYFRVHTGKKGADIFYRMIIRMLLFLSPLIFLKNPNVTEVKAVQDHWKTKKMRTITVRRRAGREVEEDGSLAGALNGDKGEPSGYPWTDP